MMLTFDTLALVLILTAIFGETARFAYWLRRGKPIAPEADSGPAQGVPAAET